MKGEIKRNVGESGLRWDGIRGGRKGDKGGDREIREGTEGDKGGNKGK